MRVLVITSAIALGIAAPASLAQQSQPEAPTQSEGDGPAGAEAQNEIVRNVQDQSELRSDWVQGTTVTTPDGETIGTIDDLLIDEESGEVTAAILSVGGFLGLGAKNIAVKWADLQMEYDGSEITLPLSKEEAEAAPEFEFRDQEEPPPPAGGTGTGGMGGTGGGMGGTGGMGGGAPPATGQ